MMTLTGMLRTVMAFFCNFVYPIIGVLFNLFMNVAKVNILSSDEIKPIYQRVTLILTIVMIFYVTFEFIKFVVQPDGITDKEKGVGKIVYKMVLVVVLIAFVPTIFSGAYKLQSAIIDNGVIGNIIIGKTKVEPDKFGSSFSANLFSMFYNVPTEFENENCGGIDCKILIQMNLSALQQQGTFANIYMGIDESKKVDSDVKGKKIEKMMINFEFDGILPVAVGIFVCYILVLYCIDLGTRWAQLVFLQVIAPIPIIGYLSPKKDGIFQKWYKQCITTYLDLFTRTAIIYFILLLTSILMNAYHNGEILKGVDPTFTKLVFIVLILGVMLFAQKAPKMLQELFPKTNAAAGNFGLKAGERVAPLAARAIGGGLGATRALGGAIARGANRAMRNKANGAKLFGKEGAAQRAARKENREEAARQRGNLAAQNRRNKRVSEADMAAAKENVQKAAARVNAKKAAIKQELGKSGLSEDNLNRELNRRMANSQEQRDLQSASANYRELNRKRNALVTDETGKVIGSSDKDIQKRRDQIKSQSEAMKESTAYQESYKKLEEARASGDKERIKEAEKAFGETKQEAMGTVGVEYADFMGGTVHETENKLSDALDRVARDRNEKYRSVTAATIGGAASGAWTGITTGAKATKLEDVWKKGVTETAQKDIKKIQAVNKYYDEGGTGFVDRVVTQAEKSIGIDTAYTRSSLETQALSSKIKQYDETITRSDNLKKSFDSAEDRLKNKIDESKVKADQTETIKTLPDGTKLEIKQGETVAEFNARYRSNAKTALAASEAATKNTQDKYATLTGNAKARADGNQSVTLNEDEQKAYNDYLALQETARKKAEEATNAENAVTQAAKYGARYTMTKMLQGKVAPGQLDEVAVQALENTKNDAAIARQDPEIFNYIQKHLGELSLSYSDFGAFVSGRYHDYDQLDRIKNAINKVRDIRAREKQIVQDEKIRIDSSKVTQAQKAANDYNGGSGK